MNKREWSDMDYVMNYIKEKKYVPKTDVENLATMLINHYDGELENSEKEFYAMEDKRTYPKNLMINIEDLDSYVYDSGGLEEFDYYC